MIAAERERQITSEGRSLEHDRSHSGDQLAQAAAAYLLPPEYREAGIPPHIWPWDAWDWKPTPHDRVRELVKAGALIAAEIDRLLTDRELAKAARPLVETAE